MINTIHELKTFLILWATQSLSQLGSPRRNGGRGVCCGNP